jgi:hypothetical protein
MGIVTIVKLQPISVVFTAPEDQVPLINKALAAGVVPVTALSSDGSKTLSQDHLALVVQQGALVQPGPPSPAGIDAPFAHGVGVGQRIAGNRAAKTQMVELR